MYKNNEIIALTPFGNNLKVNYKYSEYYKRLQLIPKQSDIPDGV